MKILNDMHVSKVSASESMEEFGPKSKSVNAKKNSTAIPKSRSNKMKPERKNVSEGEIREKLAANVELSNSAKQKLEAKNSEALGSGFMNSEMKRPMIEVPKPEVKNSQVEGEEKSDDPNTPDHLIKSDVGTNSPTDPSTTEKLKTIIGKGAFNFNSKEREVLDRILGQN